MSTYSLTKVVGQAATTQLLAFQSREGLTINLTLQQSAGVAHNGTGGRVALAFHRRESNSILRHSVAGNAQGVYSLAIPLGVSKLLDRLYLYGIWWEPQSGAPVLLYQGDMDVASASGPSGDEIGASTTTQASLPPVQQTVEATITLDFAGTNGTIVTLPPVRAPRAMPLVYRITVTNLLAGTGTPDPTAVGAICLSRNGVQVGTLQTLPQTATPGVFEGQIPSSLQALLIAGGATDGSGQVTLAITTGGVRYAGCMPSDVTFVPTGLPPNILPTLTITSPAEGATLLPGANTISFECADSDGTLNGANFRALIDGAVIAGDATITSGSGTPTVTGTLTVVLSTTGAHVVGVRVTDQLEGQVTATRNVTVSQPTLAILAPLQGATVDEGPRLVTAESTPALAANTVLSIYEGDVLLGTGTLGAGATTSVLSAGSHSLVARIVTAAGAVNSPARGITVSAQAPTLTWVSPAGGSSTAPAAAIAIEVEAGHPGGLSEIAEVAGWRVGQARVVLARVGTTNRWIGSIPTPGTEGSFELHADVTDRGGTVTPLAPITVSHTYSVPWTGAYAFGQAYASMTSPSSSAQSLALSASGASTGQQLRVTFPAGVSGANFVPPGGYTVDWSTPIAPVNGAALNGLVPWSEGGTWTVLLEIDTATQVIRASASWSYVAPADLVWYQRDTVAGGTTIGTFASVADPNAATAGVTRGSVRQGGSGAWVAPIAIASSGCTVFCSMRVQPTADNSFVAGSYEPTGNSEISFGDIEVSNGGDTVEQWFGMPAQGIFGAAPNINAWPALWEDSDAASRINYGGFLASAPAQRLFDGLTSKWATFAASYTTGNAYTRYLNGMLQCSVSLGGVVANAPDGVIFAAESAGTSMRNSGAYFSDRAVLPRAAAVAEIEAWTREVQGTLTTTSNTTIPCFVLGSSYMTTETGQTNRMAFYVAEQGTALGATINVLADLAMGAQGVSTATTQWANLQSQINRLLRHDRFYRGCLVFVDWMSAVNEQAVYGTTRVAANLMMVTQLERLRRAGCTIVMPQVSSCRLGGVVYGPDARADQVSEWISTHSDTHILYVNAALQSDVVNNFLDQGTVGQPETYGPHLAEPVGEALTGKRLVARAFAQAAIGIHTNRLQKYVRP